LYEQLTQRLRDFDPTTKVGDVFVKMIAYLQSYGAYVNHYQKANELLAEVCTIAIAHDNSPSIADQVNLLH
jgi:predicted RNA-binding protein with RPS1 domain